MTKPILYGSDYSVYVRIARMTLEEKGVDYELVPLGRIPAFEHDGWMLYETQAIMRYVDAVVPGPRLQPEEPRAAARMDQLIGIVDWYLMPHDRMVEMAEADGVTQTASWIEDGSYSRPRLSVAAIEQCAPYRFAANIATTSGASGGTFRSSRSTQDGPTDTPSVRCRRALWATPCTAILGFEERCRLTYAIRGPGSEAEVHGA